MKISISSKTLLIIQASFVTSLMLIAVFLGEKSSDYIIPICSIYIFFWSLSYSDLNKNKDD